MRLSAPWVVWAGRWGIASIAKLAMGVRPLSPQYLCGASCQANMPSETEEQVQASWVADAQGKATKAPALSSSPSFPAQPRAPLRFNEMLSSLSGSPAQPNAAPHRFDTCRAGHRHVPDAAGAGRVPQGDGPLLPAARRHGRDVRRLPRRHGRRQRRGPGAVRALVHPGRHPPGKAASEAPSHPRAAWRRRA